MRTLDTFNLDANNIYLTVGIFDAAIFAIKAHGNQMYGSVPYYQHLAEVHAYGNHIWEDWDDTCSIAAYLHDTVEDTDVTVEELRKYFGDDVALIVDLLTKREGLDYFENVQTIIDSENVRAMMVKAADNAANLNGDKSHWDEKRAQKSNAKYTASFEVLVEAATNIGAK